MSLIIQPLGNAPRFVSNDPSLKTAWDSINVWSQTIIDQRASKLSITSAVFIMGTCRFINLRISKIVKEGTVDRLQGGMLMKRMQDLSIRLKEHQEVSDYLGQESSFRVSLRVANTLYNTLHQEKAQFGATQPLRKETLLPVQRIWIMISHMIEIEPDVSAVKSKEAKEKLAWLQKQLDESSKRRPSLDIDRKETNKKAKTATSDMMKRIEVIDPDDVDQIKRYDLTIGVVPTDGPVKNRAVVTAHDVLSLAQGSWVNDAAIDAHLTLVCHTFNGLFEEGIELPKSPRYHAWAASLSLYLRRKKTPFEEKNLRQEWPPARFPNAALEDVECHIFPIHVRGNHWILGVLQNMEGQWTLLPYSSMPGYENDFEEEWELISSWLLFKSKGALDAKKPRVLVPNQQPTQDNGADCGVFVCGIVRWSIEKWDLSTLVPSIIPEYRRRMMLELEKWRLSTNSL